MDIYQTLRIPTMLPVVVNIYSPWNLEIFLYVDNKVCNLATDYYVQIFFRETIPNRLL